MRELEALVEVKVEMRAAVRELEALVMKAPAVKKNIYIFFFYALNIVKKMK